MELEDFVNAHEPTEDGETFQLGNSKLIDIAVDGAVMAKAGSMISSVAAGSESVRFTQSARYAGAKSEYSRCGTPSQYWRKLLYPKRDRIFGLAVAKRSAILGDVRAYDVLSNHNWSWEETDGETSVTDRWEADSAHDR